MSRGRGWVPLAGFLSGLVLVLAATGCDDGGEDPASGADAVSAPTGVPANLVFDDPETACSWFLDHAYLYGRRVNEETARADQAALKAQVERGELRASMVWVDQCGTDQVIHLGVPTRSVQFPSEGERGTPVLAYLQGPFYAY